MSSGEPEPSADDLGALSTAALIAAAEEHDDDLGVDRWKYVGELQRRGGQEVFSAADALTRSAAIRERVLGTSILGQIGYADPASEPNASLRRRAVARLAELTRVDAATDVVWSAINGLGHLGDPGALEAVLAHAASPVAELRQVVASAMPGATGWDGTLSPLPAELAARVVAALIALCDDEDEEVRDWALFGLGVQGDLDTPEIRDVLARHLDDPADDARDEALLGLARRRDPRAFPSVLSGLTPETATAQTVEAAAHLGDERLLPGLLALGEAWPRDEPPLLAALRTCDPAERARWELYGAALSAELEGRLRERLGERPFGVQVAPVPLEYAPQLTAEWTAPAGGPATLSYDLAALVETRLGGQLASAGDVFARDIAEADRAVG
ncbi:MAG TPA: HEAT repeat domain-containing protein [Gaiellales bacterium]